MALQDLQAQMNPQQFPLGGFPQIYNAPQQQSSGFFGGLKNFFGGQPAQTQFLQRFNPQQQQALSQILQQALGGLQNPSQGFEPIAQQARTQFQTQTIPGLAERFTAMGGGQRSSAFQGALGSAGSALEQALAAQQAQYGLQRGGQLQQLLGFGLTPQYESLYHQRQPGLLESSASGLAQLLPLLAFL